MLHCVHQVVNSFVCLPFHSGFYSFCARKKKMLQMKEARLNQNNKAGVKHTWTSKGETFWKAAFLSLFNCHRVPSKAYTVRRVTFIMSACCVGWCVAVRLTHSETASALQHPADAVSWVHLLQCSYSWTWGEGTKCLCMHECASYHEVQPSRLCPF